MPQAFLNLLMMFHDLAMALVHSAIGRKRCVYRATKLIPAPRQAVWDAASSERLEYPKASVVIIREAVEGRPGVFCWHTTVAGKAHPPSFAEVLLDQPPEHSQLQMLDEPGSRTDLLGDNDLIDLWLKEAPGGTLMSSSRELTHRRFGTRITAPMSVRSQILLVESAITGGAAPRAPDDIGTRWLKRLVYAGLTFASFAWLLGAKTALLLVAIILLHELGHAAAMWMVGMPLRGIALIPFFGGMAVPKRPYDSEWQYDFVALMGPGFSLIPTLLLLYLADHGGSPEVAHAAFLFGVVNASNLIPIPPLDGGVVLKGLMTRINPQLGNLVAWLGVAAGIWISVYLKDWLIGVAVAFGALQLTVQQSYAMDSRRTPLTIVQWVNLALGALVVTVVYLFACLRAFDLLTR